MKRACNTDLDRWLRDNIDKMNTAFSNNDLHTLFKTADHLTGKRSVPKANIKDEAGITLTTVDEELKRWERYAQVLFHANETRTTIILQECQPVIPSNPEIIKAIKSLKNNKAAGSDCVQGEFIKTLAKDDDIQAALQHATRCIWQSGSWPPSMTEST